MQRNNKIIKIRLTEELYKLIEEAGIGVGINKSELIRYLLNKSLRELKKDSIKAGGYDKLEVTLREV